MCMEGEINILILFFRAFLLRKPLTCPKRHMPKYVTEQKSNHPLQEVQVPRVLDFNSVGPRFESHSEHFIPTCKFSNPSDALVSSQHFASASWNS